jgi:protein-disulfide isomerase
MERKYFTLILVVVVGVLLGVGVVSKQAKDPLFRQIVQQQSDILKSQQKVEQQLVGTEGDPVGGSARVLQLEQRVALLETQLKMITGGLQQAGGANFPMPSQVQQAPQMPPQEDLSKVYDMPIDHSPVFGKKEAPVTLVEFVDFQCPFCARFHEPLVAAVKAFPDKANFMIKNFPLSFHPQAKPASKAAFAAGEQGKYFEMVDALLQNGNNLSDESFEKAAKEIGLDVNKFKSDYKEKDAQWEQMIQKDMALGMKSDVRGTPTFFINGKKLNVRDADGIKGEIQKILDSKK